MYQVEISTDRYSISNLFSKFQSSGDVERSFQQFESFREIYYSTQSLGMCGVLAFLEILVRETRPFPSCNYLHQLKQELIHQHSHIFRAIDPSKFPQNCKNEFVSVLDLLGANGKLSKRKDRIQILYEQFQKNAKFRESLSFVAFDNSMSCTDVSLLSNLARRLNVTVNFYNPSCITNNSQFTILQEAVNIFKIEGVCGILYPLQTKFRDGVEIKQVFPAHANQGGSPTPRDRSVFPIQRIPSREVPPFVTPVGSQDLDSPYQRGYSLHSATSAHFDSPLKEQNKDLKCKLEKCENQNQVMYKLLISLLQGIDFSLPQKISKFDQLCFLDIQYSVESLNTTLSSYEKDEIEDICNIHKNPKLLNLLKNVEKESQRTLELTHHKVFKEKIKSINSFMETQTKPVVEEDKCQNCFHREKKIRLECGHFFCELCLRRKTLSQLDSMPCTYVQILCLHSFCHYMIQDFEFLQLDPIVQQRFTALYDNPEMMETQCFICTRKTCVTLITLHDNHNICGSCLKQYAYSYDILQVDKRKHENGNPQPFYDLCCPGRNCHYQIFGFEKLKEAFSESELKRVITQAQVRAGINPSTDHFTNSTRERSETMLIMSPQNDSFPEISSAPQSYKIIKKTAECYKEGCNNQENLLMKFDCCSEDCKFYCCETHRKEFGREVLKSTQRECYSCKMKLPPTLAQKLLGPDFSLRAAKVTYEEKEPVEESKQIDLFAPHPCKIECEICSDEFNCDEIVSLFDCDHRFCGGCLIKYVNMQYDLGRGIHAITCPVDREAIIPAQTVKYWVGEEMLQKLSVRTINMLFKLFSCPKCQSQFEIPEGNKNRNITCMNCNVTICRLCNQERHDGPCVHRIELIQKYKEQDINVMPCPYCLQLCEKLNDECDHVKCFICQKDFCIACGCRRSPTLAHGNHFHRPSCRNYAGWDNPQDVLHNDCDHCKELGRLCTPPQDLDNGDIPDAEKPQYLF